MGERREGDGEGGREGDKEEMGGSVPGRFSEILAPGRRCRRHRRVPGVPVNLSHSQFITRSTRHTINSSPRLDCDNHSDNYHSKNLVVYAIIGTGSFGLHLSKVYSRCNTDWQWVAKTEVSQKATH